MKEASIRESFLEETVPKMSDKGLVPGGPLIGSVSGR